MGPSKDRREEGMDLRRQHRGHLAEAAEESAKKTEEAKRKAEEKGKGK